MVNKIHIYADTSEFTEIEKLNKDKNILGFTTNPSLMKKAKIKNYKAFSLKVLRTTSKPVSCSNISVDRNTRVATKARTFLVELARLSPFCLSSVNS